MTTKYDDTAIKVFAKIRNANGDVREVRFTTTWGNWQGNADSYCGIAARHRRLIGQVKGERCVHGPVFEE